jgi:peptide/nickel transport system permease protein
MLPRDVLCAFPWLVLFLLLMSIVREPWLPQIALIGSLVLLPRAVGMMQEAYHSPPMGRGWFYSVLWSIPVMFLFTIAGGILYTSSLSPLGWGIPQPTPELGGMLFQLRLWWTQAPWLAQWPSICLAMLLLVWVMAGDALLERLGFRSKAVWAKTVE